MADVELAAQSGESAGVTTTTQEAATTSQEAGQVQDSEQGSEVGNSGKETSSVENQGRSKGSWATERIIERALKKQSQEFQNLIAPLLQQNQPPVTKAETTQDNLGDPDYNNLNGWLKSAVDKLLQQKLSESLPQHLDKFKGELRSVSKTQEARNFLISQEDINNDEEKLAEIGQIMKDNMLDYAAVHQPLQAIQKAVNIWRKGKTNPNTPTKGQLSTVTGGIVKQGKKDFSIEELRALQAKIASGLPEDEQEKIFSQIDSLST